VQLGAFHSPHGGEASAESLRNACASEHVASLSAACLSRCQKREAAMVIGVEIGDNDDNGEQGTYQLGD
jgi:hypothetical protein